MEATNVRSHKAHLYRSGPGSSAAARDRVSFGIVISSSSFQPPIGLHKQKEVSQRVTSFEWVMIRRNLNLSLRRFGAYNKGIPELLLLLLRDPKQQQQQHRVCCVGEKSYSSSKMGDEEVKLLIKQEQEQEEDGSIEEEKKKKIKQGEDLNKSASLPEAPSPPEKPLPGDCCGNGCIPCVWDTYNEELEDYNNLLKAYNNSQFKP